MLYSNIVKDVSVLNHMKLWDFRVKNILIYSLSDLAASFVKTPFEVRK